jgi:hypothetical protein
MVFRTANYLITHLQTDVIPANEMSPESAPLEYSPNSGQARMT